MTRRPLLVPIAALALMLGLGGCTSTDSPTPAPSASSSASASAAPAPASSAPEAPSEPSSAPAPGTTAEPAPAAAATIPPRCTELVPGADYRRLFGDLVGSEIAPNAASVEWGSFYVSPDEQFIEDAALACNWSPTGNVQDPDFLFLAMGTAGTDVLTARQTHLEDALGATCTDRLEGRVCQHSESYSEVARDFTHTTFVRGDTWIKVVQHNVPTDGLLDVLVKQVWG